MSFDQFWAVYPRRVAKYDARKAWDKAIKQGTDEREMYEGARRYAEERRGQEPQYTKHPATWLNKGCWLDDEGANGGGGERDQLGAFDRIQEKLQSGVHPAATENTVFRLPVKKR